MYLLLSDLFFIWKKVLFANRTYLQIMLFLYISLIKRKKMPDKYKKDKNINEEIYKNLIFSTNSKSGRVGFFVYLLYTKADKGGNRHENCYWL